MIMEQKDITIEWLNNLTDAQIEGFERQRIGQIDKSKCV